MDKFQLAMLTQWAGGAGVQGRKRLQKAVFLLQFAGCPLDADFVLHRYGPYARDVADVCDEMTAEGLLDEAIDEASGIRQYNYKIPTRTEFLIERTAEVAPARAAAIKPFETLAKNLLGRDLWHLELGSTILFFYSSGQNWDQAIKRACEFKKVQPDTTQSKAAIELAREIQRIKSAA